MLIGGTSTPPQSLPTQRRVLYGIDESELAKGVWRREKKESIRERAKAVVVGIRSPTTFFDRRQLRNP